MTYKPADNQLLLNRELGLLEFNRRVLAQAEDPRNPLLERLKFLCIVSSNLDEFFEVRMAWLKENVRQYPTRLLPEGMTPHQAYELIGKESHHLVESQYRVLREVMFPALAKEDIHFFRRSLWTDAQREWVRDFFFRELMPVLTPIGLDPSHPFPRILNKSLNFIVELEGRDAFGRNAEMAIVQAPRILPRFVKMPREVTGTQHGFVFLSSILHAHVDELFAGMHVLGCYQFRVTRDSDVTVDDEDVKDLRAALEGELSQRSYGEAVRLEVADNLPTHLVEYLKEQFRLEDADVYRVNGPVNLVRLMQVPDQVDRPDLKFEPFMPGVPVELRKQPDLFAAIRHGDILLHHPYQSFTPVIDLVLQAARDPHVVALKMTVYRTGSESALMDALAEAAQRGKEVTAVVELMARFDEEANINWAAKLERAGVHVVYGVYGYKTHAKMLLIVRREEGKLKRYVHVGTGNYHPRTSKLYTDFGLLSANEDLSSDVNDVFMQLTGLGLAGDHNVLWQAPFTLQPNFIKAIDREIAHAKVGRKAVIIAKMNALLEPSIIEKLYEASQAGVTIHLIVRGVCALRPGIPGVSDNIRVRSIIGRFLEHHRVYYFYNDGQEDVYLSSADWMGRNLFRRIEIAFPALTTRVKRRVIREALRPYLVDNVQAWEMLSDGRYRRKATRSAKARSAQDMLLTEMGAKQRN
ncbi:polyphosphate kinase [Chitiniphilus shinanonensis]|uniref:Polyphosphate kinase n=1 Tax=Chitiniphilus shinanonensis TaxID=553088 RepID=A0ABQ6BU51_9NEIS|nr:polyphosphate kinase 1 [Chitiniphilus shinanonensis]GLS04862.1 polyphosphate kinase [Chitiniphilus shinanonensis]